MHRFLLAIVMLLCTSAASNAAAQIRVNKAWVRSTVVGQKASGAFMQITSQENGKLLGFSSPLTTHIEMHATEMSGGVMKMRAVDSLNLSAGKMLEFKAGTYHLMLFDLKKKLNVGDVIPLTLKFENKAKKIEKIEIKAKVLDASAS